MKTIGIIGGLSWQSSLEYYKQLNRETAAVLGEPHSCKLILYSVEFSEIAAYTHQGNWPAIGEVVKNAAIALEKAGADLIIIASNLIHIVSDFVATNVSIPFLHIAEATGRAIRSKGLKRVGLIGTQYTMEKDFYTGFLHDKFGIEVVVPSKEQRQVLNTIIYSELIQGNFTEKSKNECLAAIEALKLEGIEGIILGCTEFPILIPPEEIDIPSFDTTNLHVKFALSAAVSDQSLKVR